MKRTRNHCTTVLMILCAGASAFFAPTSLAQFTGQPASGKEVAVTAPSPGKVDENVPIVIPYAILLLLAGAAIGANLIPSKRGHQD